jgi:predicted dehydrogenase
MLEVRRVETTKPAACAVGDGGHERDMTATPITRRQALSTLALGTLFLPRGLRAAPSDQLRLAFVGVGGWGRSSIASLAAQHYVAFCDVDEVRAAETFAAHPTVPRYRDVRQLLDRHGQEIDGVVITTPDHSHYPLAMACMEAGRNVYLEKPMATTPWECRRIAAAATHKKVITQLGVQGHSMHGLPVLREWVEVGAVGTVTDVWFWTDRTQPRIAEWSEVPAMDEPVPATTDWRLWLADRPDRPFSRRYAPQRWRNWWGFGSGAICDIGTHMFDVLRFVFDTEFPSLVQAEVFGRSKYTAPRWAKLYWEFPARGARGALRVHWRNGWKDGAQLFPEEIPHLTTEVIRSAEDGGMAFVGSEGTIFLPDMRASRRPRIFPESREQEVLAGRPTERLPRVPGGHFANWFDAIRTRGQAVADFSYGAALTEQVLLGALAQRTGEVIRWDAATMTAIGAPEATALARPERRDDAWQPGPDLAAVLPFG